MELSLIAPGKENPEMEPIVIRSANARDAGELARLMGDLGYPTTEDQMQIRLQKIGEDLDYRTFVAEGEETLVGMIGVRLGRSYEREGNLAQIVALVVDSEWRGEGVGKLLISSAEKWARKQGVNKIIVSTNLNRLDTHRFYEEAGGYTKTGFRFVKEFSQ